MEPIKQNDDASSSESVGRLEAMEAVAVAAADAVLDTSSLEFAFDLDVRDQGLVIGDASSSGQQPRSPRPNVPLLLAPKDSMWQPHAPEPNMLRASAAEFQPKTVQMPTSSSIAVQHQPSTNVLQPAAFSNVGIDPYASRDARLQGLLIGEASSSRQQSRTEHPAREEFHFDPGRGALFRPAVVRRPTSSSIAVQHQPSGIVPQPGAAFSYAGLYPYAYGPEMVQWPASSSIAVQHQPSAPVLQPGAPAAAFSNAGFDPYAYGLQSAHYANPGDPRFGSYAPAIHLPPRPVVGPFMVHAPMMPMYVTFGNLQGLVEALCNNRASLMRFANYERGGRYLMWLIGAVAPFPQLCQRLIPRLLGDDGLMMHQNGTTLLRHMLATLSYQDCLAIIQFAINNFGNLISSDYGSVCLMDCFRAARDTEHRAHFEAIILNHTDSVFVKTVRSNNFLRQVLRCCSEWLKLRITERVVGDLVILSAHNSGNYVAQECFRPRASDDSFAPLELVLDAFLDLTDYQLAVLVQGHYANFVVLELLKIGESLSRHLFQPHWRPRWALDC
ncbi:hypothetical protein ACP70R_016622 [Stipagrostis hirtigluma subsp. patula]